MKLIKPIWVMTALLMAVSIISCTTAAPTQPPQDANAIYTNVAGTMFAQLNISQTQTAQAVPPSPIPSPTALNTMTSLPSLPATAAPQSLVPLETPLTVNTPSNIVMPTVSAGNGTQSSSAVGCDDSIYVTETEPSNGPVVRPGVNFTVSWTFQNTGTCPWINSYALAFMGGDRMGAKDIRIFKTVDYTPVGQNHTFTVFFQAPQSKGHYHSVWAMENAIGKAFGSRVWVDIQVK